MATEKMSLGRAINNRNFALNNLEHTLPMKKKFVVVKKVDTKTTSTSKIPKLFS